jgi:hypothetical protein
VVGAETERAVARLTEVLEAVIDLVGSKSVEARVNARRRERQLAQLVAAENEWKERCAGGDARAVKVLGLKSFIFGFGPGGKPVCGPVAAVGDRDRAALVGQLVGGAVHIAGEQVIVQAAYEDVAKP